MISHAALPGVCIAFLLTQSKDPFVLLLGAAISGILGTIILGLITRNSILKSDAIMGVVLSVFFGIGIVLLTLIQKLPTANQAGLSKFLFGNASTLLRSDVHAIFALGTASILIVAILWKEFMLVTFDDEYASTIGIPSKTMEMVLTAVIVLSIVSGLQAVGVVLMSAMVIAPASAARQWTDKLSVMVVLSAVFGAAAGVLGALASSFSRNIATGPTIVVCISIFVGISLFFGSSRGLVWEWIRRAKLKSQSDKLLVLSTLLRLSKSHKNLHAHPEASLQATIVANISKSLSDLESDGMVKSKGDKKWVLTQKGKDFAEAQNVS